MVSSGLSRCGECPAPAMTDIVDARVAPSTTLGGLAAEDRVDLRIGAR